MVEYVSVIFNGDNSVPTWERWAIIRIPSRTQSELRFALVGHRGPQGMQGTLEGVIFFCVFSVGAC